MKLLSSLHVLCYCSPLSPTSIFVSLVIQCLNVSMSWVTHLLNSSATSINLFVSILLPSPPLTLINSNPNTFHCHQGIENLLQKWYFIDWGCVSPTQFDIYILGHLPVCHNSSDLEWVQQWNLWLNILRKNWISNIMWWILTSAKMYHISFLINLSHSGSLAPEFAMLIEISQLLDGFL